MRYARGKSTGPKTEQGKANSAKANLKHGKYTKQAQTEHSEASAQLSQLEDAMYLLGMSDAPRSTGRKAKGYRPITSVDGVRTMLIEQKPTEPLGLGNGQSSLGFSFLLVSTVSETRPPLVSLVPPT